MIEAETLLKLSDPTKVGAVVARQLIVPRLVQPLNAPSPIEVTPLGIVTLVRLSQILNA
jgi:hypothetical protein